MLPRICQLYVACAALAMVMGCGGGGSQTLPGPQNGQQSPTPIPEIVYTAAGVSIESNTYNLDLNNDGTTDFTISEINSTSTCYVYGHLVGAFHGANLDVASSTGNIGMQASTTLAAQLTPGQAIPGPLHYSGSAVMRFAQHGYRHPFHSIGCVLIDSDSGGWQPNYLGLAFPIAGQTHYGWAEVTTASCGPGCLSAVLIGYAYDTIPGKSIQAGQTK